MTIRVKLYTAIALTILGPLATTAVALHGMGQMSGSFDTVHARARDESLARELKFGVTDMNGWQTAYGYDNGRSRPQFVRSASELRANLERAAASAHATGRAPAGRPPPGVASIASWPWTPRLGARSGGRHWANQGDPARARARSIRGDGGHCGKPGLL